MGYSVNNCQSLSDFARRWVPIIQITAPTRIEKILSVRAISIRGSNLDSNFNVIITDKIVIPKKVRTVNPMLAPKEPLFVSS